MQTSHFSKSDTMPIKVTSARKSLPTASDDRAIDWAVRNHRNHIHSTTVSGRSRRGSVMQHTFTQTNVDVDDRLDGTDTPKVVPLSARRNRGHYKPLRYRLLAQS